MLLFFSGGAHTNGSQQPAPEAIAAQARHLPCSTGRRPSSRPPLPRLCRPPGPPFRAAWPPARPPPSFSQCGLAPATPRARWPPCLTSLPPQSPIHAAPPPRGTSMLEPHSHNHGVARRTRASPPSVGVGASCPRRAPSHRSCSAPRLCSEPVHSKSLCTPPAMALSNSPSGPTSTSCDHLHTQELLIDLLNDVPHPSFDLSPSSASARRAPPWSAVSGKPPPLLWFKSLHHLTGHLLTHIPPPLSADGSDGQRRRPQPCPRVPPLLHHLGCQPNLKWVSIAGFDCSAGPAPWPTTTL
jgi:hypothetical protein